jgi:hypothetical protein
MQRKPDWAKHLLAEIQAASDRPFSWGEHDCALFACNVVNAMTGTDPAREFRGKYNTKAGSARLSISYGGIGKLAEAIALQCGAPEIKPSLAQRGDVCLIDLGDGDEVIGVCLGDKVASSTTVGLAFLPFRLVTRAWGVGHG